MESDRLTGGYGEEELRMNFLLGKNDNLVILLAKLGNYPPQGDFAPINLVTSLMFTAAMEIFVQ